MSKFNWVLASEMAAAGATTREICTALGASYWHVRSWLKTNGVPVKDGHIAKAKITVQQITREMLSEAYCYDPETGSLTHRRANPPRVKCGDEVGLIAGCGGHLHRRTIYRGVHLAVHRVCWLMFYGAWPKNVIDHINGNALDNRIANLRDVTAHVNAENRRRACITSKTQLLGVSKHNDAHKCFSARITTNGRLIKLGYYATPEEAHAAYVEAKRALHVGCTI